MEWDAVNALVNLRCPFIITYCAGVLADEDIEKGSFVVEYKAYKTYPTSERKKHDEEYATNGEGCFILEVQTPKGQWLCVDATRNVDSWARFINHGSGLRANLKMHVVQVNNEWRVALLAKVSIQKGCELFYDYGKQKDPPYWMKAKPILADTAAAEGEDWAEDEDGAKDEDAAEVIAINTIPSSQPLIDEATEPPIDTPKTGTTANAPTEKNNLPAQSDEPENATRAKDKLCQECNSIATNDILCRECGIICQTCYDQHTRMFSFSNHTLIAAEELRQLIPEQSCSLCNYTPATTYCKDCQSHVCQQCIDQHKRMKSFHEHQLLSKTKCPTCLKEKTSVEDFTICFNCTKPSSVSIRTGAMGLCICILQKWRGDRGALPATTNDD
jgi:hypothetical protein